jgi:6-phosphogluconolactonase (cycloisomerase 2 family)
MVYSFTRGFAASVLLTILFIAITNAQPTFVYTNNDDLVRNTVSAFAVGSNGSLTQIPGSPFSTGGSGLDGGLFAANRVTTCVVGNFLYAANTGSSTISGFSINPLTGFLTPLPNSPYPMGQFSFFDFSLACSPDGRFLFAGNGNGLPLLAMFRIAADGSLTTVVGSPLIVSSTTRCLKVTADGRFLVASLRNAIVASFSISANGSLAPAGTILTGGQTAGLEINCAGNLIFGGDAVPDTTSVRVLNLASDGTLSETALSPFLIPPGRNSNVVALSPDERFLFVSNQQSNTVTALNVGPGGALSPVPGSPFNNPGFSLISIPSGMATNQAGTFLFVALGDALAQGICVFSIGSNGALTPVAGSPFPTNAEGLLISLAVYPSKACGTFFDLCLQDSNTDNILSVNTTTGDYLFNNCSNHITLGGKGTVIRKSATITLQHNATDRRVTAQIDLNTKRAVASVQSFSIGKTFTIADRDIFAGRCSCP